MLLNLTCAPLQTARYSALIVGIIYGKKRYGESLPSGLCPLEVTGVTRGHGGH